MISLSIKSNIESVLREIDQDVTKQLPFAMASGTTMVAKEMQKEIIQDLYRKFTIRNTYLPNRIKITPATKQTLTAVVGSTVGFMELQQEGGTKQPLQKNVAIPVEARKTFSDKITLAKLPSRLKGKKGIFAATIHGTYGIFQRTQKSGGSPLLLYRLKQSAQIKPHWAMEQSAFKVTPSRVNTIFYQALQSALKTAR